MFCGWEISKLHWAIPQKNLFIKCHLIEIFLLVIYNFSFKDIVVFLSQLPILVLYLFMWNWKKLTNLKFLKSDNNFFLKCNSESKKTSLEIYIINIMTEISAKSYGWSFTPLIWPNVTLPSCKLRHNHFGV